MRGPLGCVVAVTYRCNARCAVCDIWKSESDPEKELSPEDYAWLPGTLRSVNLSGGEPFLRDDLPAIADQVLASCPRARVVISTNGLMPERIERMMRDMPRVAVRVSVDAEGDKHDEIRGVEGCFQRAMETVERLRALPVHDLGLAATLSERNPGELTRVRRLAGDLGISFIASAAHSSPIFFGSHEQDRPGSEEAASEIRAIMREDLSSGHPRDWAKAYYARGLIDYVRGRPRRLACGAGTDHFYLDPYGNVYPCNISDRLMGSIREGSFEELRRRSWPTLAQAVRECDEQCWMVCTVSPPMRRRPLGPLAWIAGAKLMGLDTDRNG